MTEIGADARVLGTHLSPLRRFGSGPYDPASATSVIRELRGGQLPVLVTRQSGLFVREPDELAASARLDPFSYAPRMSAFFDQAVETFNLVICQLALNGVVSAPTSRVEVASGSLEEGRPVIRSAAGGRESYFERTLAPFIRADESSWFMAASTEESVLDAVDGLADALSLATVAVTMPAFVAGAYANYSRHQLAGALLDAWIVVEQLLDKLWAERVQRTSDRTRRKRLTDSRTYTVAVRTEILMTEGVFGATDYAVIELARKHRNDLAHRAAVSPAGASAGVQAMQVMLERELGHRIEHPSVLTGVTF